MKAFEQGQRGLNGAGSYVGQLGPARFLVGLDDRLVLGQRKLHSSIGVEVAVGNVVHYLAYGPAIIPVRCIQLSG